MTVLIVGADRIGAFVPRLKEMGAETIVHWDTRNVRASKNKIPEKTDLVIFCTDYLNHKAAYTLKKQVKERCLPAVYCRRNWSDMALGLEAVLSGGAAEAGAEPAGEVTGEGRPQRPCRCGTSPSGVCRCTTCTCGDKARRPARH